MRGETPWQREQEAQVQQRALQARQAQLRLAPEAALEWPAAVEQQLQAAPLAARALGEGHRLPGERQAAVVVRVPVFPDRGRW